jgi:hypothetical protein
MYSQKQIMRLPSLTTLLDITIGNEILGKWKWWDFVDGGDGCLYGIPFNARHVVKFNLLDNSFTEIGPDFGEFGYTWMCGVLDNTGNIYCAPYDAEHILKIDTIQGTVETLDDIELPETGAGASWKSGALGADNNIYYMPFNACRIMKLNPDNDSLSSVGGDLGEGWKYRGTVVGNDDCLYGIPNQGYRIIKFDPTNPDTTSFVGEEHEELFYISESVLADDGYVYAINHAGQVLKIDISNGNYTWIGDPLYSDSGPYSDKGGTGRGWGDPIIGVDKCIYWPPLDANRLLKFDPETQQLPSLVGDDLGHPRRASIG